MKSQLIYDIRPLEELISIYKEMMEEIQQTATTLYQVKLGQRAEKALQDCKRR